MAHFVELAVNGGGEFVDTFQVSDGTQNVDRQVVILGDESNYAARARITNADPASSDYGLPVRPLRSPGAAALLAGQQAVTASAVALASNACRKVTIKALQANNIPVYVGPTGVSTSTGYELGPGESLTMELTNSNLMFVIASATGASVCWAAVN